MQARIRIPGHPPHHMRAVLVSALVALPLPASAVAQSSRAAPDCIASKSATHHTSQPDMRAGAAFTAVLAPCMLRMHTQMDSGLAAHPNVDRAFAAAMIPHHQGAIDMARQLLLHGTDPAMRSLALSIIAEQQAEIDLLRRWLGERGENAPASATSARSPAQAGRVRLLIGGNAPAVARDRVYTADQVSNSVSVIDPSTDRLLGSISLGNQRPNLLSPLYKGQINVHGLGVSPDGRTLAVISTGSNAVTLIETATNRVMGTVYVGRNPHEGFFTPDGRELWVTVRGEDHVAVIDPREMRVVRQVVTAPGPGMVVFRPDGRVAFVAHSFTAELHVVDVQSHRVLKRVPVVSPFSPNLAMSADGRQVWLTHKDVGKVTVVNARTFAIEGVIDTGPVTNHVNFGGPSGGTRVGGASGGEFAFVTIGGENAVKVYTRDRTLVTTIPVGAVPHGIWPSGDGLKMYVGLQQADSVVVIDARAHSVIARIPTGQSPQALLYVVNAVPAGAGTSNLQPRRAVEPVRNVTLTGAEGSSGRATVTIRSLGPVDGIDISASGLQPTTGYSLLLVTGGTASETFPLARLLSDSSGRANVEAIGPTRISTAAGAPRRLVLVSGVSSRDRVVLQGLLEPEP